MDITKVRDNKEALELAIQEAVQKELREFQSKTGVTEIEDILILLVNSEDFIGSQTIFITRVTDVKVRIEV